MELDGYNAQHALAFEYQGEQHYRPLYGKAALAKIKVNDERKRQLCRYWGVFLIRVPFWKRASLETFLAKKLKESPCSSSR